MRTERERLIALAGIYQAAYLTQRIARRGMADTQALEASIYSLFQRDAESVAAVYGGISGVSCGLQQLCKQLASLNQKDVEITRYVLSLIHLERKLVNNQGMQRQIADGIQKISERLEHFPMLHENIITQLADVYAETISTLQPRIMVHGEPMQLQNTENTNKIRALLLAGIRSAMLWRQCGGTRLQVLLGRRRLLRHARQLLDSVA